MPGARAICSGTEMPRFFSSSQQARHFGFRRFRQILHHAIVLNRVQRRWVIQPPRFEHLENLPQGSQTAVLKNASPLSYSSSRAALPSSRKPFTTTGRIEQNSIKVSVQLRQFMSIQTSDVSVHNPQAAQIRFKSFNSMGIHVIRHQHPAIFHALARWAFPPGQPLNRALFPGLRIQNFHSKHGGSMSCGYVKPAW